LENDVQIVKLFAETVLFALSANGTHGINRDKAEEGFF
jgi:hypothetical protein